MAGEAGAFGLGGVAGSDRDGRQMDGLAGALGLTGDADQRGSQVALDVER